MKVFQLLNERIHPQFVLPHDFDEDRDDYELHLEELEDDIVDFVHQHCKPWLNEINRHQIAWRGVRNPPTHNIVGFTKDIRQDRQPLHSTRDDHKFMQRVLRMLKSPVHRENSVGVISSFGEASEYGKVYAFLPIGNFNYAWSPKTDDWISMPRLMMNDATTIKPKTGDYLPIKHANGDISYLSEEKLKQYIYINKGLSDALGRHVEIMVSARSGLYIQGEFYIDYLRRRI